MSSALGGLLPDYRVEVAWGSNRDSDLTIAAWTDVTATLEANTEIQITRGRGDEDADPDACTISVLFDNTNGEYTPGHQPGSNWPNVVRNVPLRVIRTWGVNLVTNPSFASGTTGWSVAGSVPPTLVQSTLNGYVDPMGLGRSGLVTWGTGGTSPRITTTVTGLTASTVYTLSFYVFVPAGASPFVKASVNGISSGTANTTRDVLQRVTYTFTSTGTSHVMQVEPATAPTSGHTVYVSAAQLELGASATTYTGIPPTDYVAATAFVDDWLPAWPGQGEEYSVVQATASGRLRGAAAAEPLPSRFGCGLMKDPLVTGTANLTHFYPMNDENGSGELLDASGNARSAIPVVWSLASTSTGVLPPGFEGQAVPNVVTKSATGSLAGHALAGSGTGSGSAFVIGFRTDTGLPTGGSAVGVYIVGVKDTAGNTHWLMASSDASTLPNKLHNDSTSPSGGPHEYAASDSTTTLADGLWHLAVVIIEDTGASSVSVEFWVDGVLLGTGFQGPAPSAVPAFTSVVLGQDYGDITNLANFAVYDAPTIDPAALYVAWAGSSFEPVADRMDDLARWGFGLDMDHVGTTDTYVAGQASLGQSPLELLRTAARSDNGYIFESADGDLASVTGNSRYDLDPFLAADCDLEQIAGLEPASDDRRLVNIATVSGPTADARSENEQSTGYYGDYTASREVVTAGSLSTSRASGDTVQRHADWLANTRAEVVEGRPDPQVRFPTVSLDLGNVPELIEAWLRVDPLFKLLRVLDPPSQILSPRDLIVEGYTEHLGFASYRVDANCSPYQPVWVIDDLITGALAPSGHTLFAGITSSATSMQVTVPTESPAWITTGPFPDLDVNGESIGVTAIAALSSGRQTFTIVRAKNGTTGKAHIALDVVQLWSKHVIAL